MIRTNLPLTTDLTALPDFEQQTANLVRQSVPPLDLDDLPEDNPSDIEHLYGDD